MKVKITNEGIRVYLLSVDTYDKFITFLETGFNTHYGSIRIGRKYIHISTGGWSDNEHCIEDAMRTMYWYMNWVESKRGGHYKLLIRR